MKIKDNRIWPYLGWSMAAGMGSVIIIAVVWGMISGPMIFYMVALWLETLIIPLICGFTWLVGGFFAWLISKDIRTLPYITYIISVVLTFGVFLHYADASIQSIDPLCGLGGILNWLGCLKVEPMSLLIFLIYAGLSSIVAILLRKILIPRLFVPEIPRKVTRDFHLHMSERNQNKNLKN